VDVRNPTKKDERREKKRCQRRDGLELVRCNARDLVSSMHRRCRLCAGEAKRVSNEKNLPDFVVAVILASWTFQGISYSQRGMVALSRSTLT